MTVDVEGVEHVEDRADPVLRIELETGRADGVDDIAGGAPAPLKVEEGVGRAVAAPRTVRGRPGARGGVVASWD